MPTLAQRLSLLAACGTGARAPVLTEAIRHALDEELPGLARAAVATNASSAVAAVIRRLDRLQDGAGSLFGRVRPMTLRAAIDEVLGESEPSPVRNAIAVIVARPDPELVSLLPRLLADPGDGVPRTAGEGLLAIARRLHGPTGRRSVPDRSAESLDRALAAAGRTHRTHRSEAVLTAIALLSERPGGSLRALLDDADEPVGRAVRSAVDRIDDPLVRGNLLRWLVNPYVGRSAARALSRLAGPAAWDETLRDGHLLRTPRRREVLGRLDRAGRCAPSVGVAITLPPALQTHLPVLLERLDLPARVRRNRLADLVALAAPIARQRAVMALLGSFADGAAEAVVPFALDRDVRVARLATHGLLVGRGAPDVAMLDRLATGGHQPLARRAAAPRARSTNAGFLRYWGLLSPEQRRAAAVVLAANDRPGLIAALRGLLEGGTEHDRLAAIDIVRRRRLVVALEPELVELAAAGRPREASAAIAVLPAGESQRRFSVLVEALQHPHARVVANAVEGLSRTESEEAFVRIVPFAQSAANRPRANAVRALLGRDRPRGLPALREMLADPNPLHRVSAIWAARHAAATEALDELSRLAAGDRVPEVRVRAEAARRWVAAGARGALRDTRVPNADGWRARAKRAGGRDRGARVVTSFWPIPSLLAATDVSWIRTARPALESTGNAGVDIGAIVVAAVLTTAAALLLTWLMGLDRARHGPALRRLARGLGVGFADRRLLARVARAAGFTNACSLLVSRGCFEMAARRWGGDAARLDAIRKSVFR